MESISIYAVSLLPVILFVGVLMWLDSFAIVRKRYLFWAFVWGQLCVPLAVALNVWLGRNMLPGLLAAPIGEEFLKGLGVLLLIRSRRAVFCIDAILYGAATGAGFAFIENIVYIQHIPDMMVGTAVMRGVATALMHCGAAGGTAAILSWLMLRTNHAARFYPLAILPAIILHTLYNALLVPPYLALLIAVAVITAWFILLILHNESGIGKWMEVELFSEVELLGAMRRGAFAGSRAGQYMLAMKERFAPERFLDMYCYVQIYLELSILSKRNLMLAEAGMEIPHNPETAGKVREFITLRKQIGKAGELALAPIVKQDRLLKWKLMNI